MTFTNKAAAEMRERARVLLGTDGRVLRRDVPLVVLRFLRRTRPRGGLPPRFAIADSADQLALVKEAMRELAISEQMLARAVRARISTPRTPL